MSIQDVLKKSFLNQVNAADLSTTRILLALCMVAVIGIYIFFVYRLVCRKAFYSKSFAISVVAVGMITTIIILTVQASVVISLGMVGALSIIRFRTAVKDPMDLAFLFWSIAVGIICGAGLYEVALLGSVAITVVIMLLHIVPNVQAAMLLIVNMSDLKQEENLEKLLDTETKYHKVRSRNVTAEGVDMVIELKTKQERELLCKISELEGGVISATLMTHDGEAVC